MFSQGGIERLEAPERWSCADNIALAARKYRVRLWVPAIAQKTPDVVIVARRRNVTMMTSDDTS